MITPIARRALATLTFWFTLAVAGFAAPAITTQPVDQSVTSGTTVTFTVAATGSAPLTYQWQRNGFAISGATSASYTLPAAVRADADYYSVIVNDTSGTPTASAVARLSVAPTATALVVAADPAWNLQLEALNASVTASVPLSDGGYYVTGNFTTVGSTRLTTIMRVAADGSRNVAFTPPEFDATINTLVVQADGKIVVGGNFARIGGYLRPRLARLNADGTLDFTYNPGLAINTAGVTSLALQSDGKVLAAAGTTFLRYNSDGSRDFSYAPTFNNTVQVVALQSDGKVIAAGLFTTVTNNGVATTKNNVARLNADGSVDTTFDVGTGTASSSPFAVAIQSDGKILVGGGFTTFNGTTTRLARVSTTGVLDSAFVTAGGTGFNSTVNALALDSAQNILVGGAFATFNAVARANFARLLPTGALDTTFVLPSAPNGTVSALAVGTDSKLLLGGAFTSLGATARVALARLNIDATLDTALNFTFRSAGTINAIAAVPGGKFLIGGFFNFARGVDVPDHLIRVDSTGAVDTTFNSAGLGANNRVNAIALLGDGRVAIGGAFTTYNGTTRTRVAVLTAAGALDTTFAPAATGADNTVQALAALPNGRIALGGLFLNVNATARNRIAVLNLDGTLDTTFAPAGTGLNNQVNALTVQRDGRLLVGGTFTTYNTATTVGQFVRLNADGTLDTAFNTAAGTGFNSAVNAVSLRSDGKIVVGGNFTTYNGVAHSGVNRLNADGSQDTFGTGSVNNVFAVASLEDGSIIARGNFFISANATSPALPYLERLAADGTRDTAFVTGGIEAGGLTPSAILVRDNGQFLTSTSTTTQGIQATKAAALPTITTQPANQTATVGGSATFSVTAAASAMPLSYQWLFNGQAIAGAVNATYTIASAQLANVGSYTVAVSSELGSVTSAAATLSGPAAAPVISAQPVATTAVAGGNVTLSVTASGADSYQWRRNGLAIAGATAATYTITGAQQTDSDVYDVIAYAGLTPTASATARVTVTAVSAPNGLRPDTAFNLNLETAGAGAGAIRAVSPSGTQFYVAGDFSRLGGVARSRLARFNVDGSLDAAYVPPAFDGLIRALAVQSDGKLVVAGDFNAVGGQSRTRIARLNIDGTLDSSFIGYVGTNASVSQSLALAIQADGKILVGGGFTTFAGLSRAGLVRLNTDGTPDLAYDAQLSAGAAVNTLLLLSDGRLVVGGTFTTVAGTARGSLAILLATGALDTTFVPTGTGFASGVLALALDSSGKLLVGGSFTTFNSATQNRLARLDLTGALDSTLAIGAGVGLGNVLAIVPQAGGSFIIGGSFTTYNAVTRGGLALIGSTGTLDTTFNPGVTGSNFTVNALALDSAGALLVGGDFTTLAATARNRLGRVNTTTGALDATLNPTAAEFPASAYAIAAQPGGKFLVLSNATRVAGTAIPAGLFRLNADLTLDTSYNLGGAGIAFNGATTSGSIMRLLVAPDGKAYIGAPMSTYNGVARTNLARVNADGTLDTAYNVGTGLNNTPTALALLPGGQLLVGGNFSTYNGVAHNTVVRLNPDGSLDTSLAGLTAGVGNVVLAPASGGKIYLGGTFTAINAIARNRIARLNADGSLDTTFDPGAGANSTVQAITVLDDGRVLIGGNFSTVDNVSRLGVARLTATGAVDRTFGTPLVNSTAGTNAITVLSDGRLLQRGSFVSLSIAPAVPGLTTTTTSSFGLARLSANGVPETTISVNSVGTLVQDGNVILDDGRVLVAHANPSVAVDGTLRTGLTLLVPQVGPGPGGMLRPIFVAAGQNNASSSVFAGNCTGAVTYQWRKNGTALAPSVDHIVGTNSRQLLWVNAQAADAGSYDCVVTDGVGTFTTNAFTVAVAATAPTVLAPTVNTVAVSSTTSPGLTYVEGTPITLSASATGTAPLTYQWQRNGANIPGATATGLDLGTLTAANAGTYTLNATNTLGTVASSAVTLTLANGSAIAPVLLQNPTQQTAILGAAAGFMVTAGGTGTLSYQWKKDGVALTGSTATTSTLIIPSVGFADVGLYSVDVTNATGTTTSAAVRLSVGNASVWTWRHALPYGGAYAKTAFGAGRYVAVGYAGAISTSADGVTWTLNNQIGSAFFDIVYASGRFVAVGSFGAVITSTDGLNWTRQNIATATGNNLNSVIYDGTRYVAVGDDRTVYSSPDGATWTLRATPFPASNTVDTSLRSIAFGNGTYVTHTFRAVYTSTDLATWTARPIAFSDAGTGIYSIIFSGGNFYASGDSGDFFRSTDNGATWTFGSVDSVNTANSSESWISLASSGTRLVAVNGSGSAATSTDGLSWNIVTNFPVGLTNFTGVSYANNQFIAVGNGGMIITSPDGLAWTRRTASPLGLAQWNAVTAGTSGFVAVGNNGQLASSADGINWISRDSGTGNNFGGVTFGGGKYVAVQGVIASYSSDGATWANVSAGTGSTAALNAVTYDGTQFVGVGTSGRVTTTPDGINWTNRTSGQTSALRGVAAGTGALVAVGDTALIIRSTDAGVTWTPATVPAPLGSGTTLRAITYAGGQFVAVGFDQVGQILSTVILTSPDGATWTRRDVPYTQSARSIVYANGRYTVGGGSISVLSSADGITWTTETSNNSQLILGLANSAAGYVAVSSGGGIQYASNTVAPTVTSVSPTASAGGTTVTVTGSGFTGATAVAFNGTAATSFTVVSDTTVTAVTPASFTSGAVTVSNPGGISLPTVAYTFVASPTVTTPPVSQTINQDAPVTFSVTATGGGTLTYQWKKGATAITGATASTYTIAAVQGADAGSYSVVVTNAGGTATSTAATLTVNLKPVITTPPASIAAADGSAIEFTVTATGALSYQWRKDGTAIAGATSAFYDINVARAADAAAYTVAVTNTAGTVVSAAANLTLTSSAPVVTVASAFGRGLPAGSNQLFFASFTAGSLPVTGYQWSKNGTVIAGATAPTLSIYNGQPADNGDYSVTVTNALGAGTSTNLWRQFFSPEGGWTWRNPLPSGNGFSDVKFVNGQFLLGGLRGGLFTSPDGLNWTQRALPSSSNQYGIGFANGQYVFTGGVQAIYTSPDLAIWTPRNAGLPTPPDSTNVFQGMTQGAGRYVIALNHTAPDGTTLTSTDGITWTAGSVGAAVNLFNPSFVNGRFWVCATAGKAYSSADGLTWTAATLPTTAGVSGITFGAGRYVAALTDGTVASSTDGIAWTLGTNGGNTNGFATVEFANGQFVAVGDAGIIQTSPDGLAWTTRATGYTGSIRKVAYGAGLYVAAGQGGRMILTSTDGVAWTQQITGPAQGTHLRGVATSGTTVVAVGATGTVLRSLDSGTSWVQSSSTGTSQQLNRVASGAGLFAAAGNAGTIVTSTDGAAWTTRTTGTTANFNGVKFVNNQFLAVGNAGALRTSADGITWATGNTGTTQALFGAAYGASTYVIVGSSGAARTSPDGVTWTARTTGTAFQLNDVDFGAGLFVAVGQNGAVVTSPDGVTWTARTFTNEALTSVKFTNGQFLATASSQTYWVSADGITWNARTNGTFDPVVDTASNSSAVIAVGNFGTILTAGAPVVAGPAAVTATAPQPAELRAFVSASASSVTYQWKKGGADIVGATSPVLTFASTATTDSGTYTLVATNTYGTVTSAAATLTVNAAPVAPTVTTPPATQTVNAGASVTFTVVATGTTPITYQWQKNSVAIPNATQSTLTLGGVQSADAGSYTVVVTNPVTTVTSAAATLTVIATAPSITTQPASQTVNAGAGASFFVVATGSAPLTYQWQKAGVNISGATGSSYAITGTALADAGSYTVTITNGGGSVTSSAATLTVNAVAPAITAQPASQTVTSPATATFTVAATGTGPLTYQWNLAGNAISGATSASYTTGTAGVYTVVVTGPAASVTSNPATLTVNVPLVAPSFTSPASQSVNAGSAFQFAINPTGSLPLTYQWFKNNVAIAGATGSSYGLASAATADAGSYTVAVTNSAGTVTSTAATLTVIVAAVAPTVSAPATQTVAFGTAVSFSVTAAGTAPFTYQWQKGGVAIPGATAATYAIASAQLTDAGTYTVVVTNAVASVTSAAATLTVTSTAPAITAAPAAQTVLAGATASFSVVATGTPTLTYVWSKDGSVLPGFTGPAITLTGVTALNAGSYTVTVTNATGSVTSPAVSLTVNTPPILTVSPAPQTATVGDNITFTAAATGSGTLAFQWARAGAPIAGANAATLALPAVQLTDSGNYAVTVTSAFGSVTSNPALLTVRAAQVAPTVTAQPSATSVVTGATATFTVTAAGSAPLTYQWRKDGTALAGAVGATLTIPNTQPVAAGNYTVVVTNNVGSVTSSGAALTVTAPVVPPVVTSSATAAGGLGVPFAYLITATNTPTSFAATGLPAGLTVNPATGVVSGTPTVAGSSAITLTATNPAGSGTLALTLTVAQPAPVITSASAAIGRSGVALTYAAAATNSPTAFAATGLPAGLGINATTGAITGTPTASGTFNATLTATNSGGTSPAFPVTFTIAASLTVPVVTSAPVATGKAGDAFTYGITASNAPTAFAATGLPAGLSLNPATGAITGTPATAGRFTFSVTATNADGTSAPLGVQLTVSPSATSPVITSSATAGGTAGTALTYTITATNTPTAFTAAGLPAGLAVNATTGAITGVPSAPGDFVITLGASNAAGTAAPKLLTLSVAPGLAAPAITSSSAAGGKVGVAFAYFTAATNTPTAYTATGLPAGLVLDAASGVISGVPTAAGTFAVKLTAANAGGAGATFALALTIDPAASAPAITSAASSLATAGTLFTYQVVATNGPILAYAATGLPTGLAINPASGLVTGTPTVAGLFTVALTATNVAGSSAPLALILNVKPSALSPVVTSATTATGTQGSAFSYTVTASNMPAATPLPAGNGYTATGLPDGVALNAATGLIAGTPAATGTFTVLLTATNDVGTSAPRTLALTIRASLAAPQITSTNAAAATANAPFSYQIRGTNTPTSYDATDRPAWLAIDTATGVLSGTPPLPGTFTATLVATNAAGAGAPVRLTITATPATGSPVITSGLFATGTAGTAFSSPLAATNSPTSFAAAGLPAGLSLNPVTGVISGTPSAPGVFRVDVWAVNAVGVGGSRVLTLNLAAAAGTPVIGIGTSAALDTGDPTVIRRAAASLAADYAEFRALSDGDTAIISAGSRQLAAAAGLTATGTVGEAFTYQISAGGTPSGYSATGLPAGLALNPSTGLISGVPTVAGTYDAVIGASNDLGVGASAPFTVTIRASAGTPAVTSAATAAGTVGTAFTYQIAASNTPISYNAAGLPDGLSLDSASGVVSGTPATPGTFKVKVSANNATGSGSDSDLIVTLAAAAGAPAITSAATATGAVGAVLNYQAAASGGVTAWSASNLPAGVDIDTATGFVTGTPAVDGVFNATLTARNATGLSSPFALRVTVTPSAATSAVTSATAASVTPGGSFTYQIAAGNAPVSYNADGLPAGLTLNATTGVISGTVTTAGTYVISVSANNAAGTGPVTTFTLTVAGDTVVAVSALSNISTRANVGTGAKVLISGFVITGTDPKPVLIRAVGPTLSAFGLTGLLADPVLELFRADTTSLAVNDTWGSAGDATAIAAAAVRVGAFTLPSGSPDAVISTTLAPGSYTAQIRGAAGSTGVGLVEVYDAGTGTENSRVINLSARGDVGTGGNILIAGFVIRGTQPKTVLIRGAGPALTGFGVAGALADPRLQLFSGTTVINENDNWSDDPAIAAAAARAGAFALAAGSKDAAILVTLPPGAYTAQVSGAGATTGVAIVEVYEVP